MDEHALIVHASAPSASLPRIPISIGANGGDMETTGLEATLKNAADSKELLSELFTK